MLGFGGMMGRLASPPDVSSQSTIFEEVVVGIPCTMQAKLWGGGAGGPNLFGATYVGGGGGYAAATFLLQPGDVVKWAAGGTGHPVDAPGGDPSAAGGTSGSGTRNGGKGSVDAENRPGSGGGGATELYINGTPVLIAGGGGGRSGLRSGVGGGGVAGADGGTEAGGKGGTQTSPGAGGVGVLSADGSPGVGGRGGDASDRTEDSYLPGSGGGGGGWRGGGGGGRDAFGHGVGGGGSGYDSTGAGTLMTGAAGPPGNSSDPARINNAGDAGKNGLVVLKFAD